MVVVAIVVALVVGGTVSSAALGAPQYKVSGNNFTGTETVGAVLASVNGELLSSLPGGSKVTIVCLTLSESGGKIFGNNKGSATSVTLTGCSVSLPAGCKLGNSFGERTSAITTKEVTSVNEEVGGSKFFMKITPKTGTTFATVTLLECAGEGTFTITGTARSITYTNNEELLKIFSFNSTTGSSLKFGTQPATILGLERLSLLGSNVGHVWGVS